MTHRLANALIGIAISVSALFDPSHSAFAGEAKRVAIHVDENDPKRMSMALNNAANIFKHYNETGEAVEVRLVANGPGLHMLRADTSPV